MNCCTERSKNIFTRELRMEKKITFRMEKTVQDQSLNVNLYLSVCFFFRLTFDDDKCKASSTLQQNKELHLYL